ncbi:hypothetical protein SAMN04489760_12847 [Syntrophus gentianae]|uniref:Uncharacterized protein n=1 Tax=Syntrophus gentianae TaxID=43775 RepID=A0A1H7ZZ47_9BACT|nr:hypothetical protein SAMN04489760_12847 [Syntrophus gentianae]
MKSMRLFESRCKNPASVFDFSFEGLSKVHGLMMEE